MYFVRVSGMLQYLHDMKCNFQQKTATLRRTALHFAVLRHKRACFYKLMEIDGPYVDARDTFGNSPCHYAAEDGAVELLDELLKKECIDPTDKDKKNKVVDVNNAKKEGTDQIDKEKKIKVVDVNAQV